MKFPLARRGQRTPAPSERLATGPKIFLTLAQEGELALDQRSLPRKVFVLIAVAVYALALPLYWTATADGASQGAPNAVLVKAADEDDDDSEDDDGPDTTGNNDTGTGGETAAANTDKAGLDTGATTAGETDGPDGTGQTEADQTTGRETAAANTDRNGVHTFGATTVGETDPGDQTGKTEAR
jgi:hypothetical protein